MKYPTLSRSLALLFVLCSAVLLRASDADVIAAVRAADDERVVAIMAADVPRLNAIFSDELHYTHSNGKHDTKESYIASLVSRQTVYTGYDYQERVFRPVSPDIVLMAARVLIKAGNATTQNLNDLNVLAVWRNEGGKWRFIAWQSSKIPPATPPAAK